MVYPHGEIVRIVAQAPCGQLYEDLALIDPAGNLYCRQLGAGLLEPLALRNFIAGDITPAQLHNTWYQLLTA